MDIHRYKVGDQVRWVSQGWEGLREGRVVAVVAAGCSAYAFLPEGTRMSALHGAPLNTQEDRYLVEIASEEARDPRPFYLLQVCAAIDAPHKRKRQRKGKGEQTARAQERVAALGQAHKDRRPGPRGRYVARCG